MTPTPWTLPRIFPQSTIVVIGTGPSLTQSDVDYCRGLPTIAVNNAYTLAPWANILYAADARWWKAYGGAQGFAGQRICSDSSDWIIPPSYLSLSVTSSCGGLHRDPSHLNGPNSGHQAVNMAVHLGASRIVLLGMDCRPNSKGKTHFFGRHPHTSIVSPYQMFLEAWRTIPDALPDGVTIINATRSTAIDCFPCQPISEAIWP